MSESAILVPAVVSPMPAAVPALRVGGMVSPRWQALAQALGSAIDVAVAEIVIAGATPPEPPSAGTRWLFFIEEPAAAVLKAESEASPEQSLDAWCRTAAQILHCIHGAADPCIVLDVEEAWSDPAGLGMVLSDWLDHEIAFSALPPHQPLDSGSLWLARAYCANNRRAMRLHDELQASAMSMSGAPPAIDGAARAGIPADALTGQIELLARAASIEREREALNAATEEARRLAEAATNENKLLLMQLHLVEEELDELFTRASDSGIERERLAGELKAAQGELKAAQGELKVAQGELKTLKNVAHDVKVKHEALLATYDEVRTKYRDLQAQHSDLRAKHESLHVDHAALLAEHRGLTARHAGLQQQSEARAALAERLQNVQGRLGEALERSRLGAMVDDPAQLFLDPIAPPPHAEITRVNDKQPHRELAVSVQGLRLGLHKPGRLDLKLIAHHGRPGMVLFRNPGESPPLLQWTPAGTEGQREFVLLVPEDAAGRLALDRLGSTDWTSVHSLAALLRAAAGGPRATPGWQVVAARLQAQLASQPDRLRYDQLTAAPGPAGALPIEVTLRGVSYGTRRLSDIVLDWDPDREHDPVAWRRPEQAPSEPPVSAWPVGDNGALVASWSFASGPGIGVRQRMHAWLRLPGPDRELLFGLLDALAAAARLLEDTDAALARRAAQAAARMRRQAGRDHRWGRLATALHSRLR